MNSECKLMIKNHNLRLKLTFEQAIMLRDQLSMKID
jgi:hypothetical protein